MTFRGRLAASLSLAFLFAPAAAAQIEATLKVGVVLPLSGPMAPYGKEVLTGMEAALNEGKETNSKTANLVQIFTRDDEGLPTKTEEVGRELLKKQKVHIMFGPLTSLTAQALTKLAAEYQKPLLIPAATETAVADEKNNYVFRTCLINPKQGNILARFAFRNLRGRKAAILSEQGNAYGQEVAKSFEKTFKELGGTVSDFVTYETGTTDFSLFITNIARNAPDVVLVPGYLADVGKIVKQARLAGMKTPFLGPDSWDSPDLYAVADKNDLRGSYYLTHFSALDPHPSVKEFVGRFTQKNQNEPSVLTAMGYDAMKVILDVFAKSQSTRSEVLMKELITSTALPTLFGTMQFDGKHEAHKPGIVMVTTATGSQFMTRLYPEK